MKKLLICVLSLILLISCAWLPVYAAGTNVGDLDGDGRVTAADARFVLRAAVGLEAVAEGSAAYRNADADGNGFLEASDARSVLRAAVGLRSVTFLFQDSSAYWSGCRDDGLLKAYAAQVAKLIGVCGKGGVSGGGMNSLTGVSVVRLIDFDGDGRPELYCAYADQKNAMFSNKQAVYGYAGNGRVKTLYEGDHTNQGTDYSPLVHFVENDNGIYLVTGVGFSKSYLQLKNGSFQGDSFQMDWNDFNYYVNGKKMSAAEARALENQYTENAVNCKIWLYEYRSFRTEYYNDVLAETARVIDLLNR